MKYDLLIDSPHEGVWNMAFDESLLNRGKPIFRVYQWSDPTVSLGYFQTPELNPFSQSAPFVRRTTGGGAIVHDRELTYSLTAPADSPLYQAGPDLYGMVHQTIIQLLRDRGVDASTAQEDPPQREKDKPFLCFQRRSRYDIVLNGCKVVGSAQRRTTSAVLQHGSILLNRSSVFPGLLGINDLSSSAPMSVPEFTAAWIPILASALNLDFTSVSLDQVYDEEEVRRIAEQKYGNPDWRREK